MNPEKLAKVIEALRNGSDLETSCHYAGISTQEVYRNLEAGKFEAEKIFAGAEPDPEQAQNLELWDTLKKARAEAIVRNVALIQKAAKAGAWQAAAWWLERVVPEQFGKSSIPKGENKKALEG